MSIFSSSEQTLFVCESDGPCEPLSASPAPVCAPFVGGCFGLRLSAVMNVGRWEDEGVGWEGGEVWVSSCEGGEVCVSSWEGDDVSVSVLEGGGVCVSRCWGEGVGCDSCEDVDGGS